MFRWSTTRAGWALPLAASVVAHGALAVAIMRAAGKPELTDITGEGTEYTLALAVEHTDPAPVPLPPTPAVPPAPDPEPPAAEVIQPEPVVPEPVIMESQAPTPGQPLEVAIPEAALPVKESAPAPAPTPVETTPSFRGASAPVAAAPSEATTTTTMPPPRPVQPSQPVRSASFAGVKAERARKVVYAVDASGVMVSSLPFVLEELERNIARLEPDQQYQVIVFQEPIRPQDESVTLEPSLERLLEHTYWIRTSVDDAKPSLMNAGETAAVRQKQIEDLRKRIKPGGPSNPLTGLRVALSLKPDVVFLLSRGIKRSGTAWGPGVDEVAAALDRANPKVGGSREVQIKTVQFVEPDPTGLMDRIAREHGGKGAKSSVVTIDDLRKLGRTPQSKK